MAAIAVFDTYELLENIIINLPPVDVTRVMRVAKAWHDLIDQSKAARAARVLVPVQKRRTPNHRHHDPHYERNTEIEFHRGLVQASPPIFMVKRKIINKTFTRHYIDICSVKSFTSDPQLQSNRNFITTPSCQAVHIYSRDDTEGFEATLYIKDGIKVKDLQEIVSSLVAQEAGDEYMFICFIVKK